MLKKSTICLALFIFILTVKHISAQSAGTGTIFGKFEVEAGKSMKENWKVYFYNVDSGPPPSEDKYWRVPDHIDSVDSEDRFFVELPSGKYYAAGLKRASGPGIIGPPLKGDLLTMSVDEEAGLKTHTVIKGKRTDTGIFKIATVSEGCGFKMSEDITAITGDILDNDGYPVEGALILAYLDMASMRGKPMFVSARTVQDGKYIIRFSKGGRYYFKVRVVNRGGPPMTGEIIINGYGNKKTSPVTVKTGEIRDGINIKLTGLSGSENKRQ